MRLPATTMRTPMSTTSWYRTPASTATATAERCRRRWHGDEDETLVAPTISLATSTPPPPTMMDPAPTRSTSTERTTWITTASASRMPTEMVSAMTRRRPVVPTPLPAMPAITPTRTTACATTRLICMAWTMSTGTATAQRCGRRWRVRRGRSRGMPGQHRLQLRRRRHTMTDPYLCRSRPDCDGNRLADADDDGRRRRRNRWPPGRHRLQLRALLRMTTVS